LHESVALITFWIGRQSIIVNHLHGRRLASIKTIVYQRCNKVPSF